MDIIATLKELFTKSTMKKLITPIMVVILIIASIGIVLAKRKNITVIIDGKKSTYTTLKSTVEEALQDKKIHIGSKDEIYPALNSEISKNSIIKIKRAVNVTVVVNGRTLNFLTTDKDVDTLLKNERIVLNTEDKVKPVKETVLSEGLIINVIRVETKIYKDSFAINYSETIKHDYSMANTKKKVTQEGKNGERQVTTSVIYENGQEVSRTTVKDEILKNPINKIIVLGAFPVKPISRGGEPVPYSKLFKARATAYWAVRGVGKTYTASGRKAVRNIEGYSTIAVDPKVIPYGTKLFIENYGFAIAADTGTSIKGNKIDVFFNTLKEARRWAVKNVNVYILK